jgi:beta-fructofuranosidase
VVGSGRLHEIAGIETLQADVEVAFEIPNLEEAEQLDPKWLQDPRKLCAEKGASVQGRVGPFGLIVMASGDLLEQTTIFFRVFKHDDAYKVLMCMDLTRYCNTVSIEKHQLQLCSQFALTCVHLLQPRNMYRSSTKEGVYKPVYAGFVDVDVEKDRSISLRTLVRSLSRIV